MEQTSVKDVSIRDIEAALAEALGKLTSKEWGVTISAVTFPQLDGIDAVLYGQKEKLRLEVSVEQIVDALI